MHLVTCVFHSTHRFLACEQSLRIAIRYRYRFTTRFYACRRPPCGDCSLAFHTPPPFIRVYGERSAADAYSFCISLEDSCSAADALPSFSFCCLHARIPLHFLFSHTAGKCSFHLVIYTILTHVSFFKQVRTRHHPPLESVFPPTCNACILFL